MINTKLKSLASDTAVYGLANMIGRFINFLLVPIYTKVFLPEIYGVVTVLYAYVAFLNVLMTYGFETAFFKYRSGKFDKAGSVAFHSHLYSSALFLLVVLFFAQPIAALVGYPDKAHYIQILGGVLFLDTLCVIPFAELRAQNKSKRFAGIKFTNIGTNVLFNLLFLVFLPKINQTTVGPEGLIFIFISNIIASGITLLLLMPELKKLIQGPHDNSLWKEMIKFSWPLAIAGLAGMVNETLDRILLKFILPKNTADFEVGVYGAFYKLSIVLTIFVQGFRFAAEPFFFSQAKEKDAPKTYAKVMRYFLLVCTTIFLFTAIGFDFIAPLLIRRPEFFNYSNLHLLVVILLLANLFLGIYYNLSVWYKLSGKTKYGALMSLGGAGLTIILNLVLIPLLGIMGAAITTCAVYFTMCVTSFVLGKRFYPIPYNIRLGLFYIFLSLGLVIGHYKLTLWMPGVNVVWTAIIGVFYLLIVFLIEKPKKVKNG